MAFLDGLAERGGNTDGQVAGDFLCANAFGRKREHVGGSVFVAELAIEFADGRVGGEQDGDFTFEANCGLRFGEKTGECPSGGQA
jgi:hypothetical protein